MSAKRTHDLVATVGEYTNRQTGETKKRYQNCGSAFTNDDGNISIKLEALPLSKDWSGFLSLYPVKEQEQGRRNIQPHPDEAVGDFSSTPF
jgi:hypothetical protein